MKCAFGDPYCPCQDGDACHYVALPGSPAMKPQIERRIAGRMVSLCRDTALFSVANTISCLATAIGFAIAQSENEWTEAGLTEIGDLIRLSFQEARANRGAP